MRIITVTVIIIMDMGITTAIIVAAPIMVWDIMTVTIMAPLADIMAVIGMSTADGIVHTDIAGNAISVITRATTFSIEDEYRLWL